MAAQAAAIEPSRWRPPPETSAVVSAIRRTLPSVKPRKKMNSPSHSGSVAALTIRAAPIGSSPHLLVYSE